MNNTKSELKKISSAEIIQKLREVAWQDQGHLDNVYDDAADRIEQLERDLAQARGELESNKIIGMVEGRPVRRGDKLYVDIRGTCANEWGSPQVADQGANEGQGAMIIFEGGDYRMAKNLVWEPKK